MGAMVPNAEHTVRPRALKCRAGTPFGWSNLAERIDVANMYHPSRSG